MGFKEAKSLVISCLNSGQFYHEERNNIDVKNLLAIGAVSITDVVSIIGRARGNCYSTSPHHFDSNVDVHIIKTSHLGKDWYVKWYFSEPDSVFISVHNY